MSAIDFGDQSKSLDQLVRDVRSDAASRELGATFEHLVDVVAERQKNPPQSIDELVASAAAIPIGVTAEMLADAELFAAKRNA